MDELMNKNIYILNRLFQTIKVIDNYSSFIWTRRYRGYGDCELYVKMSADMIDTIIEDNYIFFEDDPNYLMIIKTLNIVTDIDQGNMLKVGAVGLEFMLSMRIIRMQQTYKGTFPVCMKGILDTNVIAPTIEARKFRNPAWIWATASDSNLNKITLDTQFTGQNIYDVVMELCNEYDIGFKVQWEPLVPGSSSPNTEYCFRFYLYFGTDRSYEQTVNTYVIFSPDYDNLVSSNYTENSLNFKNYALIGGEGEGSARRYGGTWKNKGKGGVIGSEPTGYNRYELFVDARDLSSKTDSGDLNALQYASLMDARGQNKLKEQNKTSNFDSEVLPDVSFKYGIDYFMGDIVQVENEYKMKHRSRIDSVIFANDSSNGSTTIPQFRSLDKEE